MEFSRRVDEAGLMHPTGAKRLNLAAAQDVSADGTVTSLALQDRIEALLERHRAQTTRPSQQEINDLYTDGCAAVLALETERLRVKRRMTAAAFDSATDPEAARDASELATRSGEIVDELANLKALVRQLRAAVDWAQEDEELAEPPRRRFRRRTSG
jgi:ABC-type phosphate transport system auxiliary subunit